MQDAYHHEFKKESRSAKRFNDPEYQRWLAGMTATRPVSARSGITSFLDGNESLATGSEDISTSSTEIGKE